MGEVKEQVVLEDEATGAAAEDGEKVMERSTEAPPLPPLMERSCGSLLGDEEEEEEGASRAFWNRNSTISITAENFNIVMLTLSI